MPSSGFENWTKEQVDAHNARVNRRRGLDTVTRNAIMTKHLIEVPDAKIGFVTRNPADPANPVVVSIEKHESTDIQKLNKLERAFHQFLISALHQCIWVQAFTLKLADDCRYTPDFVVLTKEGTLIAYETKGFFRDDAKVKLKVAARQFPIFKFILVTRDKTGWCFKEVNP